MSDIENGSYFDDELALAKLLQDGVLFCNSRKYLCGHNQEEVHGPTVVLFVICNDVFGWGCADAEDLPLEELPRLYRMNKENPMWGATTWVCFRRKEQPQRPVKEAMKKDGAWTDALEALEPNGYDARCAEKL